ncbi:MAG TPA: hypothetical protein VM818_19545 [Vicinamibacterales bacterium]|nr:hypothetical protein [Vicinamibacterales bacterium]
MTSSNRRHIHLCLVLVALLFGGIVEVGHVQAPPTFAARVAQLSEPGGYFDTDNLISNERSYLHVVPALRDASLRGGAYVGVGPDQNFSYIAQVRPSIAFIVDLRRDNLLLHLLFKAMFAMSNTRAEYLSLLFGRPVPLPVQTWRNADLDKIVEHLEGVRLPEPDLADLRARVDARIKSFGVALSDADFVTINRFHRRFITAGLPLKFQTTGRTPQSYYPTYRELLLETDRQGRRASFLAEEADFQFVRSLQQRDLVIPVVGDLAGPTALTEIGRVMESRGDRLSAFYASNVEFYLFADGRFPVFVQNLARLPHADHSLIIRSVFGGLGQSAPGYYSSSLVQPVDELLRGYAEGRFRGYAELTVARSR